MALRSCDASSHLINSTPVCVQAMREPSLMYRVIMHNKDRLKIRFNSLYMVHPG